MGDAMMLDAMTFDGLACPIGHVPMHEYGTLGAKHEGISREAQDEWAVQSQCRYQAALQSGRFSEEIIRVTIPQRRGDPTIVDRDEHPRADTTI